MSNDSDFTKSQEKEYAALPFDFFEHVVRQDKCDEESREMPSPRKERLHAISYPETCERCGRDLRRVYLWNGKRLCKSCMETGQQTWTLLRGGPGAGSQRIPVRPLREEREPSPAESLISGFLALFGLKRIDARIDEPDIPRERTGLLAVPRPDKKQMPEAEGIMNRRKRA